MPGPGFEDLGLLADDEDRINGHCMLTDEGEKIMEHHTILYIFDRTNRSNSVVAAIKESGCEVVSTNSPTEGVALLYVLSQVAAVVLDSRAAEHASFDVAQSLRRIRPSVPVILQCGDQIDRSPAWTDRREGPDKLNSALTHLLTAEAVA